MGRKENLRARTREFVGKEAEKLTKRRVLEAKRMGGERKKRE